jgi:hypothetical protein
LAVIVLHTAHTADLDAATLRAARALLDDVFEVTVPLDLSGELTCDWRDGDVW